jgi:hypothetical protein
MNRQTEKDSSFEETTISEESENEVKEEKTKRSNIQIHPDLYKIEGLYKTELFKEYANVKSKEKIDIYNVITPDMSHMKDSTFIVVKNKKSKNQRT